MNQKEFAKLLGVSQPAIAKAIRNGRLNKSVKKKGRFYIINRIVGLREWKNNGDPSQPQPKKPAKKTKKKPITKKPAPKSAPKKKAKEPKKNSYVDERAKEAKYKAELRKIEFERLSGLTILKADVHKFLFGTFRLFRDAIMGISNRIAPELVAETDIKKITFKINEECSQALEDLSDKIKKFNKE